MECTLWGHCLHPSDSGKDDEEHELNRFHGILYDYASVMAVSARKPHTKLCEVREDGITSPMRTKCRFREMHFMLRRRALTAKKVFVSEYSGTQLR